MITFHFHTSKSETKICRTRFNLNVALSTGTSSWFNAHQKKSAALSTTSDVVPAWSNPGLSLGTLKMADAAAGYFPSDVMAESEDATTTSVMKSAKYKERIYGKFHF